MIRNIEEIEMNEPENLKVIIPSATLVSEELQRLGKLPAIIYPINQKIVFDYLYEQYRKKCGEIKIMCYMASDKVRRRLERYQDSHLLLEEIPYLDDLGHTIYFGIQNIETPVILNFADTIIMDDIFQVNGDAFFYAEDYLSNIWTYFEENEGVITSIYDKISVKSENRARLFVGVFKINNTSYFKKCLESAFAVKERTESSFYYALRKYSEMYPMLPVETENWFDIGHADTYYNSSLEVKAREFNHISIDKDRGILRKSSDDKEKFIGEIQWYLKLPRDIEYVIPRIFNYSTAYTNPFICMEYYAYHTLHELFLYGDLIYHQWIDIFSRIKFVCNDFERYIVKDSHIRPSLEEMYLKKTLQRLQKMREDKQFETFFTNNICVNGIVYQSLDTISVILEEEIPKQLYDIDSFNIIHGDLCFTNIMVDGNFSFIKLIDPRGKFGNYDIYGDFRYELAKLFHSVDGKYDFIIKDLFSLEYDLKKTTLNYTILDRKRDYDLYNMFVEVFEKEIGGNLKKIELIEALLFLSMIPLHTESVTHQLVMLGTGLDILDRVISIRK